MKTDECDDRVTFTTQDVLDCRQWAGLLRLDATNKAWITLADRLENLADRLECARKEKPR